MQCQKCNSQNIKSKVMVMDGYQPSEILYYCDDCGYHVDYWAYGNYESESENSKEIEGDI